MNHRPTPRLTIATLASALAIVAVATLPGCGGGSLGSSKQGSVRLLNATSEFGTLDLASGSNGVASSVGSSAVSGYARLDAGSSLAFALRSPGNGAAIATTTATVSKDAHLTLLAYTSANVPALATLTEDEAAPPSGTARLRFLNTASAEAGPVDVYVVTADTDCAALPAITTAAAVGVGLSLTNFVDIAAAGGAGTAYNLCVVAAGKKAELRLGMPGIALASQQVATLVLTRTRGGVLVNGLLLNQQSSLTVRRNSFARVRVVAGLPAGAAVSVTASPEAAGSSAVALASSLVSPSVGSYKLVTAGALTLTVNGTASARNLVAGADATLLVTAAGDAGAATLDDDNAPSTSATSPVKLRLVNGVAGVATLAVDNALLPDSVATGSASAAALLPASSLATTALSVNSGGVALPSLAVPTLASGRVYSLFVLNTAAGGTPTLSLSADR